jgi:hypothetical protein
MPVGIALSGTFGQASSAPQSSYAMSGESVPCLFPLTDTITAGDIVELSTTTVVPGQSIAGCHDIGTNVDPADGNAIVGQVQQDKTNGSLTIPSTPSSPTLTPTPSASVSYSYQVVSATEFDQTKSIPSGAATTAVGPSYLTGGNKNVLTGLAGGVTDVYRTALGSTMPTCTGQWASGAGFIGMSCTGAVGLSFPPTVAFSGTCSPQPTVSEVKVSGGQLYVTLATWGTCLSAAPIITVTPSKCETGFLGETITSSFTDNGICGDGSTPAASGQLGPRVHVQIRKSFGAAAGVTQIVAGTNVTITPSGGTGAVTINASGGAKAMLQGDCFGTAPSSTTIGLFGLGAPVNASSTQLCTSASVNATGKPMMTASGTVGPLCVRVGTLPVSSVTWTVYDNSVATSIQVTITSASTVNTAYCDNTHTASVAQGDAIDVRTTTAASEVMANVWAALQKN